MTKLRNLFIALTLACGMALSAPAAFAGDPVIDAAIETGVIGERVDGYLGIVGDADAATQRKVQEVNNKRRALYEKLAAETGTTVRDVGVLTGEKQINKLSAGQYFMGTDGQWKKK